MGLPESSTEEEKHRHFGRASKRLVTIEPIVILINSFQGALVTLRSQYIEHRLADQLNYTLPSGQNSCASQDKTDIYIEGQTAIWATWMKNMSVFPPIVVALVLGAASDFLGRRPMFIINASGHFLGSVLFLCIAIFKLPLWLLIVGEAMLGLVGDAIFTAIISAAYVADIYSGRARTLRLVFLEGIIQLSFGIIQFVIGAILQKSGINFILVYAITVGLALANLIYTTVPIFVLETVKRRPFRQGVIKDLVENILSLFSSSHTGRRWRLTLLLLMACLWTLVFSGAEENITIYGLSPPFCWTPVVVGSYGAIMDGLSAVVAILVVAVLGLCISTYWMVYIGFISGIGYLITSAQAPNTLWLAYLAPTIGMFYLVPLPIIKAKLSEQVDDTEQGAVFGCLAVVVSLARFISPIWLNGVLNLELDKAKKPPHDGDPTITYYIASGILVLPILVNLVLHIFQPRVKSGYVNLDQGGIRASCSEDEIDACCKADMEKGSINSPTIGMFYLVPLPIIKAKLSEQVDDTEQGAVFGCLAVVVSLARFISPIWLNGVLNLELDKAKKPPYDGDPTITYYIASGILVLPILVNLVLHIFQPRAKSGYVNLDQGGIQASCSEDEVDACCKADMEKGSINCD